MYCMQMCVLILHIDSCWGGVTGAVTGVSSWCAEMSVCLCVSEPVAQHGDEVHTVTVSQVGGVS